MFYFLVKSIKSIIREEYPISLSYQPTTLPFIDYWSKLRVEYARISVANNVNWNNRVFSVSRILLGCLLL
jgi:hypothetical protein